MIHSEALCSSEPFAHRLRYFSHFCRSLEADLWKPIVGRSSSLSEWQIFCYQKFGRSGALIWKREDRLSLCGRFFAIQALRQLSGCYVTIKKAHSANTPLCAMMFVNFFRSPKSNASTLKLVSAFTCKCRGFWRLFRKKEITKKITKRITELLDARCCRLKKQQRRLEWRRTMPGLTQYGAHNGVALLAIQPDFQASCSLLQPSFLGPLLVPLPVPLLVFLLVPCKLLPKSCILYYHPFSLFGFSPSPIHHPRSCI